MTRSHPMPIELDEIDAVINVSLRNGRDSNPRYPCGYARFQVQRPDPADPADLTFSTSPPADLTGKDGSSGMDGMETCPSRAHQLKDAGAEKAPGGSGLVRDEPDADARPGSSLRHQGAPITEAWFDSRGPAFYDAAAVLAAYQSARITRAFREGVRR